MLLLSYPIINKILDRYNYKFVLIISFLINIGGYGITTLSAIFNIKFRLLALLALLLGGQFLFILGVVIAKYGLFNSLNEKINIKRKRLSGTAHDKKCQTGFRTVCSLPIHYDPGFCFNLPFLSNSALGIGYKFLFISFVAE